MAIGRAERRRGRTSLVVARFGADAAEAALDLLEITEFAWHDCYHEVTPPDRVIDDILILADGDLDQLVRACRLAITDWRDLRVAADSRPSSPPDS